MFLESALMAAVVLDPLYTVALNTRRIPLLMDRRVDTRVSVSERTFPTSEAPCAKRTIICQLIARGPPKIHVNHVDNGNTWEPGLDARLIVANYLPRKRSFPKISGPVCVPGRHVPRAGTI